MSREAEPLDEESGVLIDPTTGRPILMAPPRRNRPFLMGREAETSACPFCPGQETETPPEIDAVRPAATAPDTPGWSVRAFANLYPATPWHEVVAEGAAHAAQPAALDTATWLDVLLLHRRRIAVMEADDDVRCAFVFKNIGRRAGASIAHNHSQILALPMLPPRLETELAHSRRRACVHCEEADTADAEGRLIFAGDHHVALAPRAPKMPYEIWLVPRAHATDYLTAPHFDDLARTMHALFRAFDGAFGGPPFNMFLHRVPGEDFHWHYEFQLRTGNLAGLEIGGDMYINVVTARESAAKLRAALQRPAGAAPENP